MEMGFNREAARQALMDNNNNLEVALNSLLTGSSGSRPGPAAAESNKPQPRGIHTNTHIHTHSPRWTFSPLWPHNNLCLQSKQSQIEVGGVMWRFFKCNENHRQPS